MANLHGELHAEAAQAVLQLIKFNEWIQLKRSFGGRHASPAITFWNRLSEVTFLKSFPAHSHRVCRPAGEKRSSKLNAFHQATLVTCTVLSSPCTVACPSEWALAIEVLLSKVIASQKVPGSLKCE